MAMATTVIMATTATTAIMAITVTMAIMAVTTAVTTTEHGLALAGDSAARLARSGPPREGGPFFNS